MKFKQGDQVRVIASPCTWFDQCGAVVAVEQPSGLAFPFQVRIGREHVWFQANELVLAEYQPEES